MKYAKISAVALAVAAASNVSAAPNIAPAAGQVFSIGCTVPGATGATVYSTDNYTVTTASGVSTTNTITISGVTAGASCSAAVAAAVASYVAVTGPACSNVGTMLSSKNVISSQSGYTLDEYTINCQ